MEAMSFVDLPLSPEILRGLDRMGLERLTPIQAAAMPLLLEGRDVMGQAQTGTGKTAAFGVPMLMKVDTSKPSTQGLVLCPTRELSEQVSGHIRGYARYMDTRVVTLHGGSNVHRQIEVLGKPTHIVVGTPGRIMDLMRRKALDLSRVRVVAVDEADKMLELGFIRDVEWILGATPFVRQASLWSATLSPEVLHLSVRYMRHPRKVLVSRDEVAQINVAQYYVPVEGSRVERLYGVLNALDTKRGIIFCNTRETVDELAETLKRESYLVEALHGGFTQSQRNAVFRDYKLGKIRYVVATDVASRGLDIRGVTHVINYEVPEDPEVYFHRIGRTARKGEKGVSITLVSPEEASLWEQVREMTETEVTEWR
ncbi:MAG TPA: DEAD/DEAH box helicase [Candidatus Krumholzibacteriaceae bacterium]|nr:DEAD/DEAH box helicase [Candidatus Krumholzibacteriaceae bacterium]